MSSEILKPLSCKLRKTLLSSCRVQRRQAARQDEMAAGRCPAELQATERSCSVGQARPSALGRVRELRGIAEIMLLCNVATCPSEFDKVQRLGSYEICNLYDSSGQCAPHKRHRDPVRKMPRSSVSPSPRSRHHRPAGRLRPTSARRCARQARRGLQGDFC